MRLRSRSKLPTGSSDTYLMPKHLTDMAQATLDRLSGVPLYRQIKDIIREEILSGVVPSDQPMTEEAFIRRFGVSRAPVRQAMKELASEGLVYRERAKGTFPVAGVSRAVQRPESVRLGGLMSYLHDEGLEPDSRVWNIGRIEPTPEQSERFNVAADEKVLHFSRLISVKGEPLAWGRIWLTAPKEFAPTMQQLEETGSAFVLLEREFGVAVARVEHEAWASAADVEAAELLAVADGSPVLTVDSTFYTKEGRRIGWRTNVHRPDQFKYRFTTNH